MTLLEIRDELNVVRDFLIVVWLANASPMHAGKGSAVCTVANAAREKLDVFSEALGEHIGGDTAAGGARAKKRFS